MIGIKFNNCDNSLPTNGAEDPSSIQRRGRIGPKETIFFRKKDISTKFDYISNTYNSVANEAYYFSYSTRDNFELY